MLSCRQLALRPARFVASLVYALINTFQDKPALFSSFLALKMQFESMALLQERD
jgi:hypothetical protein